jgi:hypothetical protein
VATYSTGISVTFDSVAFTEVQSLAWNYGGSLPRGRANNFTDEPGEVTVTCLGVANVSTAKYGTRANLAIAGGGATLTCKAVYQGFAVAPQLNGVTQYTVTLRILDN